jgi:hypothetical protein
MKRRPRAVPERIHWYEGSQLTRRDLADAIEHEARMLELHVRAVHDTHGIAFGLGVGLAAGARAVVVQPGLAYGCRGASVLLHSVATLDTPPASTVGTRFDLVLVAARASSGCAAPELDCTGARIAARASLRWRAADDDERCDCDVPDDAIDLGRFVRTSAGALTGPDNARRRHVRGLVRPHVASGVTAPGSLTWAQGTSDLVASIDTGAAGFTTTPVYLVQVSSPTPWTGGLVAPFVSVGQASPSRFNVHLSIAAKPPSFVPLFAQIALAKELSIAWTGVESAIGCGGGLSLAASLLAGSKLGIFT